MTSAPTARRPDAAVAAPPRDVPPPLHGGPLALLRFLRRNRMLNRRYAALLVRWAWLKLRWRGRLRTDGIWTPILMLTAKDGEWDEVEALDTGADDFLCKPFSYPVLVARLRALVRRGDRKRPTVLRVGGLRLDPAARRVWRWDTEIELTARELAILEMLMRRPDEVVSKRDILDHVWDAAFDGDPNIVEVYVRRLRIKLDRPYGRTDIETVRGAGYRLAGHDG